MVVRVMNLEQDIQFHYLASWAECIFFLSNPYVSLKRYLILYGKQNKSESEVKPLRLNDPDSQTSEERREAKEPQTTSDV